jgi:lambda repressor-like predicted transcriptional regulator
MTTEPETIAVGTGPLGYIVGDTQLDSTAEVGMHPEQIKAAIRMKGTTPAAIADALQLSRSTVSHVISGRGTSARVKDHIAKVTGLAVATLWPGATPKMRRPKVARDQYGFPLDAKLIGEPYRPKPAPAAAKKMLRKASHAGAAA